MIDAVRLEIRYSLRRLRRSPGLSFIVVATLALAVGASTTAFSLLNATWLRAVAARDPGRLVAMSTTDIRSGQPGHIYLDTFIALRAQVRSFSALSMYSSGLFRIKADGVSVDVAVEGITPAYFEVVGAGLIVGRFLTEGDQHIITGPAPVVVTERLWRRMFGGDSRALGEAVEVDGTPVTIVGVIASGFSGLDLDSGADLFLPIGLFGKLAGNLQGPSRARYIVGRLASGVTLDHARAEVLGRWPGIQRTTIGSLSPAVQAAIGSQRLTVESLATGFSITRREYGPSFVVLVGLATLLLAIACVNLIGLMSARALARRREIAVCMALGAPRARVIQASLLDGVLLALCGLAMALPLAWWTTNVLTGMLSFARPVPFQRPMTPDSRVLVVAASVATMMGVLIGLCSAWRAVNERTLGGVRDGRAVALTLSRSGRVVLITQVALSLVLVAGTGLFARMLSNLHANDAPFRGRNIVFTRLARTPGDRAVLDHTYFHGLLEQLSSTQGIHSAALSTYFPAYLGFRGTLPTDRFHSDGTSNEKGIAGLIEFISPGFFDLFGIARLRGRDFTWNDAGSGPAVVIVSDTLARKLFPDGDAIGRHLRVVSGSASAQVAVVGVVADAPIGNIREPHLAVAYRPMLQELPRAQFPLMARSCEWGCQGGEGRVRPRGRVLWPSLRSRSVRAGRVDR